MPRPFAAQFLAVVRGCVVAVDRLQPVAVLLSRAGAVLDVVSWAGSCEPPAEWVWPNRWVAVGEDRVSVQDLPDGRPVAVVVEDGRFARVVDVDDDQAWRHPRLFRAAPSTAGGWTFEGRRTADRWWSRVEYGDRSWTAGPGSIVARAVEGPWAMASVRREPVRPWAFRPVHELVALTAGPGGITAVPVPALDVAAHCWPPRPGGARAFEEYLPWSQNLARAIGDHGNADVELVVDGRSVDITFTRAGDDYLLHDEPLDELDRPVGLRFWDLGFDELSAPPPSLVVR